jgi:sigma-B regulation protein RsbU (phosphoserine phosphatase)
MNPRPKRPLGLATRLSLAILTGAALIFIGAFGYNHYTATQAVIQDMASDAQSLTLQVAYKLESILQSAAQTPRNMASLIEDIPYRENDLNRMIKGLVEDNPNIFGMAIAYEPGAFDPGRLYFCPYGYRDGKEIKMTMLGGESYDYFSMDWYHIPRELNRHQWSEPYYDEGGGNIVMSTFAMPFYDESKNPKTFRGVVTADLSLIWLEEIVSAVKVLETGYAFLISKNGVFVTCPQRRYIMRESIFSLAEEHRDEQLRHIGRRMIAGDAGLAAINNVLSHGKPAWLYFAPLPSTGWSLGVVFPKDELLAPVHLLSRKLGLIAAGGLALLGALIIFTSRRITLPLGALAQQTEVIAHGDFTAKAPETGAREVAHLARSFNRMGDHLVDYIAKRDFIRDTFGRYVTQDVVKRLLESEEALELGGEIREVTILMSDLRGFTALTAGMDPEQVIIFLNRYLGKMIEILLDHHAVIDEIVGDGILAFFGAPEKMEDHPLRAVACALHMQGAMEEINRLNAADSLPHLEMGIGINTGHVVVGNIGSEKRTKYSVVGAHVNFTSRVEAYALGGQVLIGASTYARVKDHIEVGDIIQAQMKGVPGAVTIYDVHAVGPPYNIHLSEKVETLTPLPQRLPVQVLRITDKVITGQAGQAWALQLCEASAMVAYDGELTLWEDVRLNILDASGTPYPGKIYGKVTEIFAEPDKENTAHIRFTSVSPDLGRLIREFISP